MGNLSAKIPKDIRDYQEKLFLGMTARQLVAITVTFVVCVPLYIFGRMFIPEDLIAWAVLIVGAPLMAIGFYKKNGLTAEKAFVVWLRREVLYPQKTNFKQSCYWRELINEDKKLEKLDYDEKKMRKYKEEATLERALLMLQAEENGELRKDIKDEELLTASKPPRKSDQNKKKDKKEEKKKERKATASEKIALAVEEKQKADPHYVPTKKEAKAIVKYNKEVRERARQERLKGKKVVKKTNEQMKKRRTAKSFIPKTAQDEIPYIADYAEGMFEVEKGVFSKCYEITDINYKNAKEDEQIAIISKWKEFLNFFSEELRFGIYIDNRLVSVNEQERKIFMKLRGDDLDIHRVEWNKILKRQLYAGHNDIQKSKYITLTIECDSPYEALLKFHAYDTEVLTNLRKVGAKGRVLSTEERLALLHDKFRKGREGDFRVDFEHLKEQGLSSKDYICPSSFWWKPKNHFAIDDTYCRCVYLTNLPNSLDDSILNDISSFDFPIISALLVQPMAKDKAVKMVKHRITGMEANKQEAEKKAIRAGYDPSSINHDLKHSYEEGLDLLEDITRNDEKLFFVTIVAMISADTEEELDKYTQELQNKVRAKNCQIGMFDNQQRDAMKLCLPMGVPAEGKVYVERVLTTNATSVFMPFSSQELFQMGGKYYGLNQNSKNMILCDRKKLKTPSGWVLGSSGSGKSFACKQEMMCTLLGDDKTNLFIIDPENEYTSLAIAFSGEVINLTESGNVHINPLDITEDYGLEDDDDPDLLEMRVKKDKALRKKSNYIMSIINNMVEEDNGEFTTGGLTNIQKGIIDEALREVYKPLFESDFSIPCPTLQDLLKVIYELGKNDEDALALAKNIKYYITGSADLFAHETNVNLSNRFITFSVRDLKGELRKMGLLVTMDFLWDKMIKNFAKGIRTEIYVDEAHTLCKEKYSEAYLQQFYKRCRKFGGAITCITQDVTDLLKSTVARSMIQNSDFILMLNQNGDNVIILKELLHMSDAQCSYVTQADRGTGLIFAESVIVPFENEFPKDSYLYKLISTNFEESKITDVKAYIDDLRAKQYELEALAG